MRPTLAALTLVLFAVATAAAVDTPPTPRPFAPPSPTGWRPEGCRAVPVTNAVLGSRDRWRMLHSDSVNSDEVTIALAPVFEADWQAEPNTFNVTVPTFDAAGNLYFAPFLPYENVVMISLDPRDGSRRWAIPGTGAPVGAVAPMVLNDPDHPGAEIIYLALRDRAIAVRTDGTIVWDVPTGLSLTGVLRQDSVPGMNYLPQLDAIVGLTGGGQLYVLSRATGAPLLDAPFELPGEPSPAGGIVLPPALVQNVSDQLAPLINFPPGSSLQSLLSAILGNEIEVSNSFSIDPGTGRLWVAATAPDAADGTVDGVSELGAIYGLDVVPSGTGHQVVVGCSRYFPGGSASTPDVRADGTRVYVGDNFGALIALDADCNDAWTVDVGSQIVGSVGTSSDNGEIYAATQTSIVQVIDDGASAHVGWTANLDVYTLGAANQQNFNLLLASVGANGVGFMAGAGIPPGVLAGIGFPYTAGYGVLDRATGTVRYFADGLDESVAELNVGPDGGYYNANSPIRRAFTRALVPGFSPTPVQGGIRKFVPRRNDLLIRDGVCAARDRAANALAVSGTCPASAAADQQQIGDLVAQARRAAPLALAENGFTSGRWGRVDALLDDATGGGLAAATAALDHACGVTLPCPVEPRSGCRPGSKARIHLKRLGAGTPNADLLRWSWASADATDVGDFGDPRVDADYGVCVYAGPAGGETLVYDAAVPAAPVLWSARPRGFGYTDRQRAERGVWHVSLKGGVASALDVRARGAALAVGALPATAPITAQLVNLESGACWEGRFESGTVTTNNTDEVKARMPH